MAVISPAPKIHFMKAWINRFAIAYLDNHDIKELWIARFSNMKN